MNAVEDEGLEFFRDAGGSPGPRTDSIVLIVTQTVID